MRNGLAVAGIAGGLWFLGNAVANADTVQPTDPGTTQSATAQNNTSQTTSGDSGSGSTDTSADSTNVNVTKANTDVSGGDATNNAGVNTGVNNGPTTLVVTPVITPAETPQGDKGSTTNLTTGDVNGTQNSAGGNTTLSGNAALNTGPVTQTANATNNTQQTTASDEDKKKDSDSSSNDTSSSATAENKNITDVTTNVSGGNATNNAWINTGLIGVTFNCPQGATCIYNITTGNVTLIQNAKGGDVVSSGNVGINAPVPGVQPAVQPAVHPVKKVVAHPVVLSAAQPTAVLATTGAEWGMPLTVGLIALAAGTGLTLAGRRRETATV